LKEVKKVERPTDRPAKEAVKLPRIPKRNPKVEAGQTFIYKPKIQNRDFANERQMLPALSSTPDTHVGPAVLGQNGIL